MQALVYLGRDEGVGQGCNVDDTVVADDTVSRAAEARTRNVIIAC